MKEVIGVRFEGIGQLAYYLPGQEIFTARDGVVCNTERGLEYGVVTLSNIELPENMLPEELDTIIRKANSGDYDTYKENEAMAQEALKFCRERAQDDQLDMSLVGAEYTLDRTKLIFYFTSDHRVDFRKLVRELAQNFHTRIELRQIGVRDQARILGGIGPCGQELCCHRFMNDFEPVSIKMAKTQGLSLNPTKISGLCGRLMCCLNYEQEVYLANTKKVPAKGTLVLTEEGQGYIVERDVLQTRVRVHIYKEDGTEDEKYFDVANIEVLQKRKKGKPKPELWESLDDHEFITEGEKMSLEEDNRPFTCPRMNMQAEYEELEVFEGEEDIVEEDEEEEIILTKNIIPDKPSEKNWEKENEDKNIKVPYGLKGRAKAPRAKGGHRSLRRKQKR